MKKLAGLTALIFILLSLAPAALAAGDGCAGGADAKQAAQTAKSYGIKIEDMSCQKVSADIKGIELGLCVQSSKCTGENVLCCVPGTGAPPAAAPAATAGTAAAPTPTAQGSLLLPACISDGNCTLTDIVTAGASFANFLFGLAGMVALGILVYAGILYVFFAAGSGTAAKAKKMLGQAVIGLVIIFGANALIRFVSDTLVKPPSTTISDCDKYSNDERAAFLARQKKAQDAGETFVEKSITWSCIPVAGPNATKEEIDKASQAKGGKGGCLDKCKLSGQGKNVLCCPSEPLAQ